MVKLFLDNEDENINEVLGFVNEKNKGFSNAKGKLDNE